MARPLCSLIVVNYNGLRHLQGCFGSLQKLLYPPELVDVIMVDNGSQDESIEYVRSAFPLVRTIVNTENNFAKALNLGVNAARGQYVGFLNNDVSVEPHWLQELVTLLESQTTAGAAGGKILFKNGRINSVGHCRLPNFYFEDRGFNEEDRGQYDTISEVEGLCWAAVLFRKKCLEDVGAVDEDFVMYFEDVDFATRCQGGGWKLFYTPVAVAHHVFQGSSRGTDIAYYFCSRNRFLYVAKHSPEALPQSIATSHFFINGQQDLVYECMPITIKKLVEHNEAGIVGKVLPELCWVLMSTYGTDAVDRLLARMQVILGHRKMSAAIYDHALHTIGGGQKYVCTMASAIQDQFDTTYIANKEVDRADLDAWYRLDLSRCQLKIVKLPFYEERKVEAIDPTLVTQDVPNAFEVISRESRNYDLFVNANMLEKVKPLAPLSIFVCHFPDRLRSPYFSVDDYTFIIANCSYTIEWMKARWGLTPSCFFYPPVDMGGPRTEKENIILSVTRFEIGGSKKQKELIAAYNRLLTSEVRFLDGWRLVLAGGSLPNNPYLEEVLALANTATGPVDVLVNVPAAELQALYAKSKIFWHACGLQETDPHLVEHFGMTTVEAMQNYCVPVVFNGGGQREIVEHGRSGFLFKTLDELCEHTLQLVADTDLLRRLQEGAYDRSQRFTRARFEEKVRGFFDIVHQEYSTIRLPDPKEVVRMTVRWPSSVFARSVPSWFSRYSGRFH